MALIITGLDDIWFHLRGRKVGHRVRDLAEGVLSVGLGALFLVFPVETLRVIMLIASAYLAVRGLVVIAGVIKTRNGIRDG